MTCLQRRHIHGTRVYEKYSVSFITRKMSIKTTVQYYITLIGQPFLEKQNKANNRQNNKCWSDCCKNQEIFTLLLFSHWIMSDSLRPHGLWCAWLPCPSLSGIILKGNSAEIHQKLKAELPCDPVILFPVVSPEVRICKRCMHALQLYSQ